jgi:hypothetical protein
LARSIDYAKVSINTLVSMQERSLSESQREWAILVRWPPGKEGLSSIEPATLQLQIAQNS